MCILFEGRIRNLLIETLFKGKIRNLYKGKIKNLYEGKIRNLFKGRINLFEVKIRSKITEHEISVTFLLIIPLIFLFFISFLMGKYPISPQDVLTAFASKIFHANSTLSPTTTAVLFQVRLPRIMAAMMVGAALSIAGASFQGLFRNPLVSSDKLGVSAGAGFGAAIAIFFSASAMMIQFSAFVWGLVAVALTYSLGRSFKGVSILNLLLCGIAVETFFAALLSMTKYIADPEQLQSIVFWILGSLAKVTNQDVLSNQPANTGRNCNSFDNTVEAEYSFHGGGGSPNTGCEH